MLVKTVLQWLYFMCFLWAYGELLLAICLKVEVLDLRHSCLQLSYTHWGNWIISTPTSQMHKNSCFSTFLPTFIFFDLYKESEILFYCRFNLSLNIVRLVFRVINHQLFFLSLFFFLVYELTYFFYSFWEVVVVVVVCMYLWIWILFLVRYEYYRSLMLYLVYLFIYLFMYLFIFIYFFLI